MTTNLNKSRDINKNTNTLKTKIEIVTEYGIGKEIDIRIETRKEIEVEQI